MQQTYRYRNIIIKPHWMQFVINELHLLVLTSVGFVYAGIDDAVLSTLVFVLSLLLSLCLAYRMVYLCRMRYIICNEQLVFEHGVFHREVDYQELYRVVDFNESQTFMQQLFRLKTVSIYSGDRTTPRLDIIGVSMKENLVTTIRERVETSKRRRSIYEITNR
nr:PH domain-containing protein [Prevotella sp.]